MESNKKDNAKQVSNVPSATGVSSTVSTGARPKSVGTALYERPRGSQWGLSKPMPVGSSRTGK